MQLSLFKQPGPLVVNFKDYGSTTALDEAFGQRWHYVGRSNPTHALARSALANKYKVGPRTRQQAIELYSVWLTERIAEQDEDVLRELVQLDENSVLVCWCKPKACHADIIADVVRRLSRLEQPHGGGVG